MNAKWNQVVEMFKEAASLPSHLSDPENELLQAETGKYALLSVLHAYLLVAVSDPKYPLFLPFINWPYHGLGANPDMKYQYAAIEESGTYRVWGKRNTVHMVLVQLSERYYGGPVEGHGRAFDNFELDELDIKEDGSFEFMLSPECPDGFRGNWRPIPKGSHNIFTRQIANDWSTEVDAELHIERLDNKGSAPPRRSAEDINAGNLAIARYAVRAAHTWLSHIENLRARGVVNQLELGGQLTHIGGMTSQCYYQGAFDIAENEALVISTDIPSDVKYWNIQVTDEQYLPIDYCNRISSYNGHQAHIASDGRFYAVLSGSDPGVPNWLDTGSYSVGCLLGRWNRANATPLPKVVRCSLDRVRDHLPVDVPQRSANERETEVNARRTAFRRRYQV